MVKPENRPSAVATYRARDMIAITAEDAWYETPKMKAAMAESVDDLSNGRVETYLTEEDFLTSLGD
jgi:hypothetical protein